MDLVIQNELPTAIEREAVDAVLGPPGSSWEGAPQASKRDHHLARGGHAARAQRHLLLPTFHAVQSRVGWISRGALNYVCRRLTIPPAEAYGVASFYALFSLEPQPPVVTHVCTDVACIARGSQELVAELERRVAPEGAHPGNGQAVWHESPCLGMCERAPAALATVAGEAPHEASVAPVTVDDIASLLAGGDAPPPPAPSIPTHHPHPPPQSGDPSLRLLRRVGVADPESIDSYRAHGGYEALRAAIEMGPGPGAARGVGLEADGPRRRRVPDRAQVGGRRPQRQAPALPHLQRRRVRAGDVQGPRDPRARPVLHRRVDDDRRHRDGLRARLPLPPRRVPAGLGAARRGDHGRARPRVPGPGHPRPGPRLRHRAAQGRRGLHLRRGDRAVQLDRGLPRRAAQQAAVPGRRGPVRQADGDQQRRDARQRARHRHGGRPGVREDRHGGLDGHAPVLPVGPDRAPRPLRGAVRDHAARGARAGRRRPRRPPAARDPARRRRRALRHARRARRRDVVRGDAGGRGQHGLRAW